VAKVFRTQFSRGGGAKLINLAVSITLFMQTFYCLVAGLPLLYCKQHEATQVSSPLVSLVPVVQMLLQNESQRNITNKNNAKLYK